MASRPYMVTLNQTIFDVAPIYCHIPWFALTRFRCKSLVLFPLHINKFLHPMVIIMHQQATNRTESMLRITTETKRGKIFLSVEGRLAGPWVAALEQCWRELRAASPLVKNHMTPTDIYSLSLPDEILDLAR